MRTLRIRAMSVLALLLIAAGGYLIACGDDSAGGNGGSANDNGSANGNNETTGDDEESTFDVTIEDDDGGSEAASGKQSNEEASEDSWGASINHGLLNMTLLSSDGVSISVVVETTESLKAPGTFAVSTPPDGTHVVLIDAVSGQAFDSDTSGSVRLDNCPSAVGDKVVGGFENIVLEDDMSGETRTLNGDFDVAVYAALGELHCEEDDSGSNQQTNNQTGPQCDWEYCDPEGACCPYATCMAGCDQYCLFEDPDCNMGMDPVACGECIDECYIDECGISNQCVEAIEDGMECEELHGCDEIDDEDAYEECLETHCCDEMKAAF